MLATAVVNHAGIEVWIGRDHEERLEATVQQVRAISRWDDDADLALAIRRETSDVVARRRAGEIDGAGDPTPSESASDDVYPGGLGTRPTVRCASPSARVIQDMRYAMHIRGRFRHPQRQVVFSNFAVGAWKSAGALDDGLSIEAQPTQVHVSQESLR